MSQNVRIFGTGMNTYVSALDAALYGLLSESCMCRLRR